MKKAMLVVVAMCVAGLAYAGLGDALKKKVGGATTGGESPAAATATGGGNAENDSKALWDSTAKFVNQNQKIVDGLKRISKDVLMKHLKQNYTTCKEMPGDSADGVRCGKMFSDSRGKWCSMADADCYKKGKDAGLCVFGGGSVDDQTSECPSSSSVH